MNYPQPAPAFGPDDFDFQSEEQGVEDSIWPSAPFEPDVGVSRVPNPQSGRSNDEHPGEVRTAEGPLDMLNDVIDEIDNVIDTGHLHSARPLGQKFRGPVIDTFARASDTWRGNTYDIGTSNAGLGIKVGQPRSNRARIVVTNWGPGIAYVGRDSNGGAAAQMNVVQIPVNGSREFRHADEIYAFPAIPGTSQIVDTVDEFGYPQ